jgi:hypothetical protein
VRIIALAGLAVLGSCVDLSTICPKQPITQGVFGEIVDGSGTLEENIEVDAYSLLNGMQDALIGSAETTRGGFQFNLLPSEYELCANTVCTQITVPTGLVEYSAVDGAGGLTWDTPVAVPPEETIGPCTWGSD